MAFLGSIVQPLLSTHLSAQGLAALLEAFGPEVPTYIYMLKLQTWVVERGFQAFFFTCQW